MTTTERRLQRTTWTAVLALATIVGMSTPSSADKGFVRAVITRGSLLVGVKGGHGTLAFHGRNYALTITGMSFGASVGASTVVLTGHAYHMREPGDIEGAYSSIGAGGALVAGAARLRLQNARGVVLELSGAKVGAELSVAVGGIWVTLR
jgi:hypothetical protein